MHAILREPAIGFDDERFDVADVVLCGLRSGLWQRFELSVAQGLALQARGASISTAELRAAAHTFRRERGLTSAAEFKAWLATRRLSASELTGYLSRRWLIEHESGRPEVPLNEHRAAAADGTAGTDADELSSALRVDAIASGTLSACADRLVGLVSAASGLQEPVPVPGAEALEALVAQAQAPGPAGLASLGRAELERRAGRLLLLEAAAASFVRQVCTSTALERRLAAHGLDWLRIDASELTFTREGAAREARLLMAHDGLSIDDVAAMLGLEIVERSLLLADVGSSVATMLATAQVGETVGPSQHHGAWRLLVLRAKRPPSLGDAELRERARREVVETSLGRLGAGHVTRDGHL